MWYNSQHETPLMATSVFDYFWGNAKSNPSGAFSQAGEAIPEIRPLNKNKNMKKYFWILLSLIWLLWTSVFATYEDFSNQLETMWLDVQKIESQDFVSRYELARLLNMVECKDCIYPQQDMINKYVQSFWAPFVATPGKDFRDIDYLWGIYNDLSYYYCVAYVGDNTYMRWYPQATSPVCGGQFCGTKNTTTAEFLQVVINILSKYIYKDIGLNWKEVNTWVKSLKEDSYEAKNFNSTDRQLIADKITACNQTCALQNNNEVNLYLKWCMFNLKKCDMQAVGNIKEGYRPVAELNLLSKQDIIDLDKSLWKNTGKSIDGKTVLETLFKLNGKVDCAFNNDYDCDGLDNVKDSCINAYNPKQKDFDKDGIGDACDDDIDNDGAKNPIGIVDDEGKVDIWKLKGMDTGAVWWKWTGTYMDNCLFTINSDQEDNNQDGVGDICKDSSNQMGIYIDIDKLEWSAPLTTTFTAMTSWNIQWVSWDFGDGTQWVGNPITHTFISPGMYNVQSIAKWNIMSVKAQVIVIIGGQAGDDKALQTRASMIGGKSNIESMLSVSLLWTFDEIQWIFTAENSTIKKGPTESFKKIFKTPGTNPVMIKWYRNNELAWVSYFNIWVEDWKGSILRSNSANPEVNQSVLFDTKTYNITQEDIMSVLRDFGDNVKKSNTTLTMEYAYTKPGKKVITQTITFTDGETSTNMITINVIDKTLFSSYALLMIPSKLITKIGEKVDFSTSIIGTLLKTPLMQILEFADGTTQKKPGSEKLPSLFSHSYQNSRVITPQDNIFINQCSYLRNQATISVQGVDMCLDAKLQWNLNKVYKCDMDKDWIPDICDTDIDGDGIINLLGLINVENNDCSYGDGNGNGDDDRNDDGNRESGEGNGNGNLNQETMTKHYQWVCSLDNAPFNRNPDQLDLNQDGIGDEQGDTPIDTWGDTWAWIWEIDTDGDWIPDIKDLAPTIQETRNGITDEDGVPEVGEEITCNPIDPLADITNNTLIIKPTVCNQCPCQFWDFASDLANNDQVRAILRDKKKTIQYKFSQPRIVTF